MTAWIAAIPEAVTSRLAALELGQRAARARRGSGSSSACTSARALELEQLGELGGVGHLERAGGVDRDVHRRLRRVRHRRRP